MIYELEGRLAIVTGGAQGIGEATVRLLHERRAAVAVLDRDIDRAQDLVGQLGSGAPAAAFAADGTEPKSLTAAFERATAELGPPDIMVNNLGGNISRRQVELTDLSDWKRCLDLNLTSAFLGCQLALPGMKARGRGRIVNLSSVSAFCVLGSIVDVAYAATKAGIIALTRQVAAEAAPFGIAANAVCPGFVSTSRIRDIVSDDVMQERESRVLLHGRMVRPEEVAEAVAFLSSDRASMITGSTIVVDGGVSLGPVDVN